MRNPFRKCKDQYPAILEIKGEWMGRLSEAAKAHDAAEIQACLVAINCLNDWVVYVTVGNERCSEEIPVSARRSAEKAAEFSRLCSKVTP